MKRFSEVFKNKVAELDEVRCSEDVIIHFLGEEAKTEDEALFIQQTNAKYFNNPDSETLLGNFAEIKMVVNSDENKTNFIRVNLDEAMDEFYDKGWEPVLEGIKHQLNYANRIEGRAAFVLDNLTNYGAIKDSLIIRPLNYEYNKATINESVFTLFGDMALVLYVVVYDDVMNSAINTIKVPISAALQWNVSIAEATDYAMQNTVKFAPARIYTNILQTEDVPDKDSALMSPEFEMKHLADTVIPLVTTERKTNGAIALFYPGVKDRIAEMFDGSFYVAFTSIHEAMIHKAGTLDPRSIKRHVVATNRAFGKAETLSSEVYYYNRETGEFHVCETE